jgi:hypothetical protein
VVGRGEEGGSTLEETRSLTNGGSGKYYAAGMMERMMKRTMPILSVVIGEGLYVGSQNIVLI